jgi:hypothetical protein
LEEVEEEAVETMVVGRTVVVEEVEDLRIIIL